MREITRNFGLVTTFRILVDQDHQQLAAVLKQHATLNTPILIVPLLASEYALSENQPIFENILANLSQAEYLDKIIFGLDQASESDMQLLKELIDKHHIRQAVIQWNDGPVFSDIYQMLNEAGILSLEPGKGKNIFLGIGIALALHAKVVGILMRISALSIVSNWIGSCTRWWYTITNSPKQFIHVFQIKDCTAV